MPPPIRFAPVRLNSIGNGNGTGNGHGNSNGTGSTPTAGNDDGLGRGIGTDAGSPGGPALGTTILSGNASPAAGPLMPQTILPPVVPPIPGSELGDRTAGDSKSKESAAFALKREPPPFERKIDPASPQSLLGPSSHQSPGSTVSGLGASGRGASVESAANRTEPQHATVPTPQDLLFGSLQPTASDPVTVAGAPTFTSSQPAASQIASTTLTAQEPAPAPAPSGVAHRDRTRDRDSDPVHVRVRGRNGTLHKLMKPKVMIPIAILVIAGAMVASVMATVNTKAPVKALLSTGSSKSGTHPSTKALSHGKPIPRIATAHTLTIALRSPADDARPDITVRVGDDAPIDVVLDTGSVGLRLFSDLVPTGTGKGIHVTGQSDSVEYVDGTQFSGPVAQALVHVGKLTTTTVVPFQLVQSVTCDPTIPDCPASGGASQFQADGVDGIMGIGLSGPYPGDPTTNPLLSLPAPYRNSWSVAMQGGGRVLPAPGTLVLGAHDPTAPAADFSLQQAGASVHGLQTWNDQFNLCWSVGGISSCELSVFDSGSDLTVLGGTGFASVPTNAPGQIATLTTGTAVQASQEVDSNPLWSFTSGDGAMQTVIVEPSGINWVNSGVQAFYSFTVTYDEVNGSIFLS